MLGGFSSVRPWRARALVRQIANGHLMLEDPEVVIQGDGVLHLRYPVHRGRLMSPLIT
jgi:hypothetical protein